MLNIMQVKIALVQCATHNSMILQPSVIELFTWLKKVNMILSAQTKL